MDTLIVPQSLVPELLPMAECVDVMAEALLALANGDAVLPLRSMVWMPDKTGLLGLMPAYLGAPRSLGLKVISYLPGNHGGDRDSHKGAVLLFDTQSGTLLAVIDASSITAIRTAAVSGLATRLLAREDHHQSFEAQGDVVAGDVRRVPVHAQSNVCRHGGGVARLGDLGCVRPGVPRASSVRSLHQLFSDCAGRARARGDLRQRLRRLSGAGAPVAVSQMAVVRLASDSTGSPGRKRAQRPTHKEFL